MPITGELAWDLWLIPDDGADPIRLDSHPGDPAVPGTAPSFAVYEGYIAWAAFDRGPDGVMSQLLYAHAPEWRPQLIAERFAAEAELWFPSLYGRSLVYSEIRYSDDRLSDERWVFLVELNPDGASPPRRLDASGQATMPLINQYGVVWKEADPGFHMLNWGRMFRYDLETGVVSRLSTRPQEYVNFPSIGERFVAWWGANASTFGVYDLERGAARQILRYAASPQRRILRPHVGGGLLVWLSTEDGGGSTVSEIRYAYLPGAGADRLNPP
jgi:hypothetical protein